MSEQKHNEEKTPFENFQQLLKQVLSVPKEKVDEQRAEHEREKQGKKRAD